MQHGEAKCFVKCSSVSAPHPKLTERLDHHRWRGQQSITVKHVTVNADQAMVAENITTTPAPALQNKGALPIEQIIEPEIADKRRGGD